MDAAIRDHHVGHGEDVGGGRRALDATSDQGARYVADAAWPTLRRGKPEGDGR